MARKFIVFADNFDENIGGSRSAPAVRQWSAFTIEYGSLADVIHFSDVKFLDWLEDVTVFEVAPRHLFPLSDWVETEHEVKFSVSKAAV